MASLADAEEALRSTSSKANFQRLTRLLMCGGVRLLRETFDSIHSPADLPVKLSDPAIQAQLRGARLTRPQWDCLYPSPGVYGKSTDFDITLIFRLLRTICNLIPPPGPRGWDDLPNNTDHSLEADLVRIKYYRNEVFGHSNTLEISDVEFDDLWRKISEALIRIAASISHAKKDEWKKCVDYFFLDPLTPEEERYIEELDTWYKQDMDVKTEVKQLKEEFKTLAKDIKGGQERIQEEVAKQFQRPLYTDGPVVILVVNTIESITQAGLPIILNHPSGRPHIPLGGESLRICTVPVPDQEAAESVSDSGGLQLNPLEPPTEIQIWNVILSFKNSFKLFLQYLVYKLNVFVRNHDVGSLLIRVECESLQILEGLWEDYRSGHLNEIVQEMLVTAEVLEKLGLDEVKLKTFISEEEYAKGKQIFMGSSVISKKSPLSHGEAADRGGNPFGVGEDTVPEELTAPTDKEKHSDVGFPKKSDPSAPVKHKTDGKKHVSKVCRRKRRSKTEKMKQRTSDYGSSSSLGQAEVDSTAIEESVSLMKAYPRPEFVRSWATASKFERFQPTIDLTMAARASSSKDYLQRISNLEKENTGLSGKVRALEQGLKGIKEYQQRHESKMFQLQKKNVELEERLVASENERIYVSLKLTELQDEVRSIKSTLVHKADSEKYHVSSPFLSQHRRGFATPFGGGKGFCQIIINRQKHEVLFNEEAEIESVFQNINFDVHKVVCGPKDDVELKIDYLAGRDYSDKNSFVCFILSSVTKNWEIENLGGKHLNVTKLMAKFSSWESLTLERLPKIFIIQGDQKASAHESDEPVGEKPFSVELPVGRNFLCLFVPYRKGYISTLLSVIKLHGSDRDLLYILSEAKKLFYSRNHITIPDPVHNFSGPVYLGLNW